MTYFVGKVLTCQGKTTTFYTICHHHMILSWLMIYKSPKRVTCLKRFGKYPLKQFHSTCVFLILPENLSFIVFSGGKERGHWYEMG